MRSYLLLLRFMVFNVVAFALLAAVWVEGWVSLVFESDITRISAGITIAFVVGWLMCLEKVVRCSRELNAVADSSGDPPSRLRRYLDLSAEVRPEAHSAEVFQGGRGLRRIPGALADCLRSRLYARIAVIRTISNSLVVLGLIGTVIGFIIALTGIDANAVADIGAIAPMVSTLIQGMSVALYTTLVGAVFHVWLLVNYQVLATGTVNLVNTIIERAEAPAHFRGAGEQVSYA